MNPLATELNEIIRKENPEVFEMLSNLGKEMFFPKGILTQSAEAKVKAKRFNATLGVATEGGKHMSLPSLMKHLPGFTADEAPPATTLRRSLCVPGPWMPRPSASSVHCRFAVTCAHEADEYRCRGSR